MWYLGPGEGDTKIVDRISAGAFHKTSHQHRVFCNF